MNTACDCSRNWPEMCECITTEKNRKKTALWLSYIKRQSLFNCNSMRSCKDYWNRSRMVIVLYDLRIQWMFGYYHNNWVHKRHSANKSCFNLCWLYNQITQQEDHCRHPKTNVNKTGHAFSVCFLINLISPWWCCNQSVIVCWWRLWTQLLW